MKFNNERDGWKVFLAEAVAFFLVLWFVAALNGMGQEIKNPDSTWIEAESIHKEDIYIGKALYYTCPYCGKCKPRGGDVCWTTAMYCFNGCCNTSSCTYFCETTGKEILIKRNECDWVVWLTKKDSVEIDTSTNVNLE